MTKASEFCWHHIRERLPAFRVPVLVDTHEESKRLPCVAWREDEGAGGWRWDNGQDECETYLKKLRYWAHIPDLPERMNFLVERRLWPPVDENEIDESDSPIEADAAAGSEGEEQDG